MKEIEEKIYNGECIVIFNLENTPEELRIIMEVKRTEDNLVMGKIEFNSIPLLSDFYCQIDSYLYFAKKTWRHPSLTKINIAKSGLTLFLSHQAKNVDTTPYLDVSLYNTSTLGLTGGSVTFDRINQVEFCVECCKHFVKLIRNKRNERKRRK